MRLGKLRGALTSLVASVRADQETVHRFHHRYGGKEEEGTPLPRDLIEKIGLQLMAAYRVMRFFEEVEAGVAARLASRLIRHLYGSDIHWNAEIAPGVMVVHGMGMAISHSAKIDQDVLLFQHCTLGEGRHPDTKEVGAPHVEEGAVIGAGATLLGPITIGARSKIMPGCVVLRSVPPGSIVESPASVVKSRKDVRPPADGDRKSPRGVG